jgi:hypothetical protein
VDGDVQPSMALNGMKTMRLHRLHLSSSPRPRNLAMSWPHSQRVSTVPDAAWDAASFIIELVDIENNY